jgi:hypothetical protein
MRRQPTLSLCSLDLSNFSLTLLTMPQNRSRPYPRRGRYRVSLESLRELGSWIGPGKARNVVVVVLVMEVILGGAMP